MIKTLMTASALLALASLGACGRDGSAEKAGEHADSAIEDATQGHTNAGDGALEKAGESVDHVTGQHDSDAVDGLHDATDNNTSTHP